MFSAYVLGTFASLVCFERENTQERSPWRQTSRIRLRRAHYPRGKYGRTCGAVRRSTVPGVQGRQRQRLAAILPESFGVGVCRGCPLTINPWIYCLWFSFVASLLDSRVGRLTPLYSVLSKFRWLLTCVATDPCPHFLTCVSTFLSALSLTIQNSSQHSFLIPSHTSCLPSLDRTLLIVVAFV